MELQALAPAFYANRRQQIEQTVDELERTLGPEALRNGAMPNYILDVASGRSPQPLPITAQSSPQNFVTRRQFERQYPELYEKNAEALNAVVTQFEKAGKPLDVAALAAALVASRT